MYAQVYDLLWDNPLTDTVADAVVATLDARPAVLEAGAGTGLVTAHLLAAGFEVDATEPDRWMRARFRRRCGNVPVANLGIEDLAPDPLAVRSVVAVNVVHLTDSPARSIRRLRVAAGPGGQVVVVTPAPDVTFWAVVGAQRRMGTSPWKLARFVVIHLLMRPVVATSGLAVDPRRLAQVPVGAVGLAAVGGVSCVLVYRGLPETTTTEPPKPPGG